MHQNYAFISQLSRALAQRLGVDWQLGLAEQAFVRGQGAPMHLHECFSQQKDELVMGFANDNAELWVRACLESDFTALSFPQGYARAKRNSVDLMPELRKLAVLQVLQLANERSFAIFFEQDYHLIFKLHGRRANAILWQGDDFVSSFHKRMTGDAELSLAQLDRPITQTWEAFAAADGDWKSLYPSFGKEINTYLAKQGIAQLSPQAQWALIQDTLHQLQSGDFYLLNPETAPELSLLPPAADTPHTVLAEGDALSAATEFFNRYTRTNALGLEKQRASRELQKRIRQTQNYIDKSRTELSALGDATQYEQTANIIMANLHQIPAGTTEIELFDFYTNQNRLIKLKRELSPQRYAETLYRKAKNAKIERETRERNLSRREQELHTWQQHLQQITAIDTLKELRNYLKTHQLALDEPQKTPQTADLFKKYHYQGFDIWVGKNAKNNDLLTQQYARKDDLWLHAKDVAGSHVVIKYQAGKTFPRDVIEKAASLAAYYSKRKQDSLCPVSVTPRKYVRKTKDLAPGQVLVEREEVVMVVPEAF